MMDKTQLKQAVGQNTGILPLTVRLMLYMEIVSTESDAGKCFSAACGVGVVVVKKG